MSLDLEALTAQANSAAAVPVHNPATLEVVARVPDHGPRDLDRAIDAVVDAFPAWAGRTAGERSALLAAAADAMRAQVDDLARILTLENGKPLDQARAEVLNAAASLRWNAEEATRLYGRVLPPAVAGRRHLVVHAPVGPVAAISPWNFPSSLVARKVGAALAAGCTMVLKPATATPLSALAIQRLLHDAGVPRGVLEVVTTTRARAAGQRFTSDARLRKLTFTGSTAVGKELMRQAADTLMRVNLELGGHAPFLVFADADVDATAEAVVASKFKNSGQTCICTNRLYVQRDIAGALAERVAERATALRVGNGLEPGVDLGPLIDRAALDHVAGQVADAVAHGAVVACGGRPAEVDGLPGAFWGPTVLTGVDQAAAVMREETFGPVLPLATFDDEAEALALANDTPYGLAAYAYTRDVGRVFRLVDGLDYGLIGVNSPQATHVALPFGGMKESGIGREEGMEGVRGFLEAKAVTIGL